MIMKYINFHSVIILLMALFFAVPSQAQLKLDFGKDSPLRKLQIAEIAISNLYVDTVNQQ